MNRQITHLFVLVTLLFALLVAFTSRWTVFEAESLENETANRRPLLEEARIPRGTIFARDGKPLTRNIAQGSGQTRTYKRFYPTRSLFAQPIGYSFIERGRAGLEKFRNRVLIGGENEFSSIIDELEGAKPEGKDLRTALDPGGQRAAFQALGGENGSVVAIEPSTGRVRVMASVPSYDPNQVPDRFQQLDRDPNSPLLNRATQSSYPPGSTFKVVTAAAALDSGKFTPESVVDGASPKTIGGVPLTNAGGQSFGPVSLTQGLTNSVNTVWAQVGEQLGKDTMFKYMDRFGFNQDPRLDYPDGEMNPSGEKLGGKLLGPDSDQVDVGRMAIGQDKLAVTPLQMAMVPAAVANRGVLMEPRLTEAIIDKDGRKDEVRPRRQARVMSAEAAGQLGQMMGQVVREGTGTAGALSGIDVAGKTGTAEVDNAQANQAWFLAFAPVDDPKMAIAVTVERTQGQGGEVAAPIAKQVLQQLLGSEARG